MNYEFPSEKRHRVIINTDAKNEADDQFAIVHALLTPSLEVCGIIPAHFGLHPGRTEDSMEASREEVNLLLRLMRLDGKIQVSSGATRALADEKTPRISDGADLIVAEALKDDPRTLDLLFLGPLTDLASAILMEPKICQRNLHLIWVGGADYLTHYGKEFNLSNDVHAANIVMRSPIPVSQIPYPLYGHFCVSHSELLDRVYPHGELGFYLTEQLIAYNLESSAMAREYRSMGDSATVGVLLAPYAGRFAMKSAPQYDPETCEVSRVSGVRQIREYESFDTRFLMEDFFAKLKHFSERHICVL